MTPYLRYAFVNTTADNVTLNEPAPPAFAELSHLVLGRLNYRFDQQSLALGIRWDINPQLAFKAQWERSWVDQNGAGLWWKTSIDNPDTEIDTFSINLDFVF